MSANKLKKNREHWSSKISFIWVAAGAAVGLGNVWKFPYMAGENGGSAFVLMYLCFILLIAIPLMVGEIMLGRLSQKNPIDGFVELSYKNGLSRAWHYTAYLGLFTLLMVFCFYSVVAGFSISYLYFCISDLFRHKSTVEIQAIWTAFLAKPSMLISSAGIFIFFTMAIVGMGIKNGIEKACKVLMPALLLVLIILVFCGMAMGGFSQALDFLFAFKLTKITSSVVISSLGHAFFTLAVGACCLMSYGSYLPKDTPIVRLVFMVALLDTLVALLSGLAIFPLIFNNNLSPSEGPGLMFISLPIVFASIPLGSLFGSLFFILLFFAALSSAFSFAEPLVESLIEKLKISRAFACMAVGCVSLIGSIFCALSFNSWQHVKIFSKWTIFDFFTDISTNLLLPLGGIAISIFCGLVIKPSDFANTEQKYARQMFAMWRVLVLIIAPAAIIIVMINGLIGMF